ncbi:hypothetical protein [Pseudonocardia endophytica]|uniref:Uncharacterized protein n=1 Tax=Pseudonocardia endophytica TaxID=401976 RepID=A0A4R1HVF6_PSEEN|nr:hypothetical protein [Pseudonocardia endophytica]TCK21462.1 hypothetical protein EV378_5449 [Pseudonocardia endophytica]
MTRNQLETKGAFDPPEKQKENFREGPPAKDTLKEEKEQQEKIQQEWLEYKQGKDATKGELNEKTKVEGEKDPKSEGKNESKDEGKEWKEKQEKDEAKEGKDEFKDDKEAKPEHESKRPEKEPELIPLPGTFDRRILLAHADALDESARVLRHFIEQDERPDLRGGALSNEPDHGGHA